MRAFVSAAAVRGVGLSVATPFEVLFARILSGLFNEGRVALSKLANISFEVEETYFGKQSSLTNQCACAFGGFVDIDFKDSGAPIIEEIAVDFNRFGHAICIVNLGTVTKYNDEIETIRNEMNTIAQFFDCENLRSLAISDIMLNLSDLRYNFGDRAVLRAIHFFRENDRVERIVHALKKGNFDDFLNAVNESGNSSFKYLQNVYSGDDVKHQDISIALNVAEHTLHKKGACRICSEGFSGIIQAFVPKENLIQFKMSMERVCGAGKCSALSVRNVGVCEVLL